MKENKENPMFDLTNCEVGDFSKNTTEGKKMLSAKNTKLDKISGNHAGKSPEKEPSIAKKTTSHILKTSITIIVSLITAYIIYLLGWN